MIRLLIVDDHDVVRMGLKQVFSGRVDMEVAGEARTGEEAIAQVRASPFDVALVDLSLSDMSGVDVLNRSKAIRPEMAVHGRFGRPCPVCAAPVQRIVYAENECNYCARCQTGGKLLADRSIQAMRKSASARKSPLGYFSERSASAASASSAWPARASKSAA